MQHSNLLIVKGSVIYIDSGTKESKEVPQFLWDRPLVVISNPNPIYDTVNVCMTGTRKKPGIKCSLYNYAKMTAIGHEEVSTIYPYQIFTIHTSLISNVIGVMNPYIMAEVDKSIDFFLGRSMEVPKFLEEFSHLFGVEYQGAKKEHIKENPFIHKNLLGRNKPVESAATGKDKKKKKKDKKRSKDKPSKESVCKNEKEEEVLTQQETVTKEVKEIEALSDEIRTTWFGISENDLKINSIIGDQVKDPSPIHKVSRNEKLEHRDRFRTKARDLAASHKSTKKLPDSTLLDLVGATDAATIVNIVGIDKAHLYLGGFIDIKEFAMLYGIGEIAAKLVFDVLLKEAICFGNRLDEVYRVQNPRAHYIRAKRHKLRNNSMSSIGFIAGLSLVLYYRAVGKQYAFRELNHSSSQPHLNYNRAVANYFFEVYYSDNVLYDKIGAPNNFVLSNSTKLHRMGITTSYLIDVWRS